jgi:tetratricopeptide (TPR) repeat protein
MLKAPHRITFLGSVLKLPKGVKKLEVPLAKLLHGALERAFVKDAQVAWKDANLLVIAGAGKVTTVNHRDYQEILATELGPAHRDEVLWFEIDLTSDAPVTLHTRGAAGREEELTGPGGTLAASMNGALTAWRAARGLPAMARSVDEFGREELLATARILSELNASPDLAARLEGAVAEAPPALRIPLLRSLDGEQGVFPYPQILAIDPEDPRALMDRYLYVERAAAPKDFSPLERIVALAPNFVSAYRQWRGEGVDGDRLLDAMATAAFLDPSDDNLLELYARAVGNAGGLEAGHALALRAMKNAPHVFSHITGALETSHDLIRPGYRLALSERTHAEAAAGPYADWFNNGNPEVVFVNLGLASGYYWVGRLEEAIALRGEILEGMGGSWPNQTKVLTEWKTLTDRLTKTYMQEGRERGDLGRVLEGHSLGELNTTSEISSAVLTLCELGEPRLGMLAFAHAQGESARKNPTARLAGALAAMASGELDGALRELITVELRSGRQRLDSYVNRILRVGSSIPLVSWEEQIAALAARGARTVAQLVARNAADFVEGCDGSAVVLDAFGKGQARTFSSAWLDPLATELFGKKAAATRKRLDAALAPPEKSDLAGADHLATAFWSVLGKSSDSHPKELLYVAVSAACRYLTITTAAPSVVAGGYRQAATIALQGAISADISAQALAAVLVAFEKASVGVAAEVFDAWLLRFERALCIEERVSGRTAELANGLPTVSYWLRGDLAIGYELATADRIATADPATAFVLYQRCVRAGCASNVGYRLMKAAERCQPEPGLVDAAYVALYAAPHAPASAVLLAERAFARGEGAVAFDLLVQHLGKGNKGYRQARAAAFEPAWKAASLDVPLDFDEAQMAGLMALQGGDFEKARRCYAWCNALDPDNAVTLKNLGMVSARLGDAVAALAYFASADKKAAPTWTAHELMAARKFQESMPAHRYASLFYDNAALFIYAAKSAWFAGDDESKLFAIRRARALDPASVDLTFLNGLADAAGSFGADEESAAAGRELIEKGKDNPTFLSLGHYHVARALLRGGKDKEALVFAQDAAKLNPLPDNKADFDDLVDRCKKNQPPEPKPMRTGTSAARALKSLLEGDAKAGLAVVARAKVGAEGLARLVAARYRETGEEAVLVTPRALDAARDVLAGTAGAKEPADSLARAVAMKLVEDACAPVSPPATLGKRFSRDAFREGFVERGGVIRRPIEVLP